MGRRIAALERRLQKSATDNAWIFTRSEVDGRISSIFARSADGSIWPEDATFKPPIEPAHLPGSWLIKLKSISAPVFQLRLDGIFGGVVEERT
jgi:hypothetical protein